MTGAGDDEVDRRGPAVRSEQEDTMAIGADAQVAEYLAGVRRALADLPEPTRRELLEDLAEHLAEVAAEADGSLVDRLGPPGAYAAELRASAGVPPPTDAGAPTPAAALARLSAAGRSADLQVGALLGYRRGTEFAVLLRPGWWVLRGYLVAVLGWAIVSGHGFVPLGPPGWLLPHLVLVGLSVWLSVRLGQRPPARQRPWRAVTVAGNLLLPVVVLFAWAAASAPAAEAAYADPYAQLELYPYGPDGQPLRDVRLLDQYGNQVAVGAGRGCLEVLEDWHAYPSGDGGFAVVPPAGRSVGEPVPPPPVLPACDAVHPRPSIGPLARATASGQPPGPGSAPPGTPAPTAAPSASAPPAPEPDGSTTGPAGEPGR